MSSYQTGKSISLPLQIKQEASFISWAKFGMKFKMWVKFWTKLVSLDRQKIAVWTAHFRYYLVIMTQ